MKTIRPLTLLAVAGALLLPASSAPAENALRTDTSGHLTTPLDLGDTQIIGTLDAARLPALIPPARLGSGAPSSATVLRGDGTWAGTTATGNTVAATNGVLMGDGAGNAVAVRSGADLLRVLRARLDSLQASQTLPVNLLPLTKDSDNFGLVSGTVNADGTLTVPANGSLRWNLHGDAGNLPLYGYMVATSEPPAGALVLDRTDGYDRDSDNSTLAPGTFRSTFLSTTAASYPVIVKNTTASPITIFPPVLAYQDTGLALLTSFTDHVPVAPQPVADLDFSRFASADRAGRYLAERQTTIAADSVNGSAGNAGSLYAPKLSLQQTLANTSVFGLYRGSVFRESLPLSTLGATHGIVVQDAALSSVKPLPVVSALALATNGSFSSNGDGTYSYLWTPAETLVNDGYSNVYVVEINTATEANTPIASRRRLLDVSAAPTVAGTVWVQAPGTGAGQSGSTTQWKATLYPSDGLAPGSGVYRYEVVSRVQPANWGNYDTNPGDGAMSGLMLVGGSSGYGSLSGPRGFVGDRLVFLHATTHNAVIAGGSLQRSVFYESGDLVSPGPSIQLAWYAGQGAGLRWDTRQCLFYMNVGNRFANGLIAHTAGTSFERGDLSDTAFIGARWSDGSTHGTAIDYVNVAAGVIERVYVQAVNDALGLSMPLAAEVRRSVFRQVNRARVGYNFHDNVVLAESGSDPVNVNHRSPIACLFQQSGASATQNVFWARGLDSGVSGDSNALGVQFDSTTPLANCTFARNVVVIQPASTANTPGDYFNLANASLAGMNVDYNLVISLSKVGFHSGKPGSNYFSWADYQAGTGLDAHSLYLDLSADPRGVQAVFADPLNGDFRWAQTDVGRRCAAWCAANHAGPEAVTSRWPVVPGVDDAVRLITDL